MSNKFSIITCNSWYLAQYRTGNKKLNYLYCNALSNKFQAEWNVAKINSNGKCESEIFFLPQLLISWIYAVDLKLLNLREVFLQKIIFYIDCAGESDIDR